MPLNHRRHEVCIIVRLVRSGSFSNIMEVCKSIEGEMEDGGGFDLGNIRDDKEGEGGGDASSASGAGMCGFHAETPPSRSFRNDRTQHLKLII